ncbi:hypothetical protein [Bacillus altitudinis]|uniref:hypothetical protein n=1 Tax=Bacillus altitudinis TaxID=293387 RepID=UPI003979A63D
MSRVFTPEESIMVQTTRDYPNTMVEYKVSVGSEKWKNGEIHRVYKVQMCVDGKARGRQCPSFLADTDDFERVYKALDDLKKKHGDSKVSLRS